MLWSRTLELLDRGGGSDPFVDAGFKAEAVNFIAGDKLLAASPWTVCRAHTLSG